MRRVYVTSLFRFDTEEDRARNKDLDGRVYVLDWDSGEVLNEPLCVEPGNGLMAKSGRSSGARGIAFHQDRIYVAGSGSFINVFDPDTLRIKTRIQCDQETQGSFHIIREKDGILYVPNTRGDSILKIQGVEIIEEVKLEEHVRPLLEANNARGDWYEKREWGHDKLHFNSIGWDPATGDEYHMYFGPRMLVNFTKKEIVLKEGPLNCPHDIVPTQHGIFTSSSGDRTVLLVRENGRFIHTITKEYQGEYTGPEYALWGFTRGLAYYKPEKLLVTGVSPGTLRGYRFEGAHKVFLEKELVLTMDNKESIFDVMLDPRDWIEEEKDEG